MILTIHQPNYLPWLGFFHKIILSDVYVAFDDVQFEKNSFNNRNKIKVHNGWTWLTIPIITSGQSKITMINNAKIKQNSNWNKKHFKSIKFNYAKAEYYDEYINFFNEVYNKDWQTLADLNIYILKWLFKKLNIRTDLVLSSEIKEKFGSKDDLVLSICNKFNTDIYISGPKGKDYINEEKFKTDDIKIHYHDYTHPKYSQLWESFLSHMSIIDLLFNHGHKSKKIIMENNLSQSELDRL